MPRDLVDPDGFLLVDSDGYVVDETCEDECCDGCTVWRLLVSCPGVPSDCFGGQPPPERRASLCASVVCQGTGEPVIGGMIVAIDGQCWRVDPRTFPTPPTPDVIPSKRPVVCVAGCTAPECGGGGALYYVSRPCNPADPPILVCGVDGCAVHGCHVIDSSGLGIPYSQIPPGTPVYRAIDLGPRRISCCDSSGGSPPCGNCVSCYLTGPTGSLCGSPVGIVCCYTPGTLPVIRSMRSFQSISNPLGGPHNNGSTEMVYNPADRSVHITRIGLLSGDFERDDRNITLLDRWPCAGGWGTSCLRLFRTDQGQYLTGNAGDTWGTDAVPCESIDLGNGAMITVTGFSSSWQCRRFSQSQRYRYFDPAFETEIITSFEATVEMVPPGGGPDSCDRNCGGRIHQGVPGAPGEDPIDVGPAGGGLVGGGGLALPSRRLVIPWEGDAGGCAGCGAGQTWVEV